MINFKNVPLLAVYTKVRHNSLCVIVNQKGTSKLRQKGTNLLKIFYAILPPDLDLLIR